MFHVSKKNSVKIAEIAPRHETEIVAFKKTKNEQIGKARNMI